MGHRSEVIIVGSQVELIAQLNLLPLISKCVGQEYRLVGGIGGIGVEKYFRVITQYLRSSN